MLPWLTLDSVWRQGGIDVIASAMSAHSYSSGLQVKACRALRNFADNSAENQVTRLRAANSACRVSGVALRLRRVPARAFAPVFARGCARLCWWMNSWMF